MSKRVRITFASLLVLALGVFAYAIFWPREPEYEGKSLRYWLEQANVNGLGEDPAIVRSIDAVQHMGTNAIPTLLAMARAKDSPLEHRWLNFVEAHPQLHLPFYPASQDHELAAFGFSALDSDGKPAVPALIELLKNNDPELRDSARGCLGCIGPAAAAAIPLLLPGLNDSDQYVRMNTVTALGGIHSQPEVVLPLLIKDLNPTNDFRIIHIAALGRFGEQAKSAVPVLLPYLNDTDESIRAQATNALQQIDPEAAAQAGIK